MGLKRNRLREEAKKIYKDIPKKQRMPFPEFYKRFKLVKQSEVKQEEDFDFEDMVNVNDLNEEDIDLDINELDEEE